MTRRSVLALVALLGLGIGLTACGGDSAPEGVGAAGSSGSAGAGGSGGTLNATRKCGDGAPCSPGATCEYYGIESGVRCECDPSSHFLCDSWSSAGAPPFDSCNEHAFASGAGGAQNPDASCAHTNGYCTRTCNAVGCEVSCDGTGPSEPDPGRECAPTYCDADYWGYGACKVDDGACDYEIDCIDVGQPRVTGSCE